MPAAKDWLLFALAHRRGAPMTPVQVQKAMFLMRMEAEHFVGREFYEFKPYNYGPFNSDIYVDLQALERAGDVVIDGNSNVRTFAITAAGLDRADRLKGGANEQALAYLGSVVDWVIQSHGLNRALFHKRQ